MDVNREMHENQRRTEEGLSANLPAAFHPIDPARLQAGDYFASLTEESLACGLLTEGDLSCLQAQLPELLRRMAVQYAGEGSASLPVEVAGEMLRSLQMVLGAALKGFSSPEDAAAALKTRPLGELYDEGLGRVRQKLRTVRVLQRRILTRLFQTPNVFWRSTIEGGVNGFFRLYRPEFAAHELSITADYPPLLGRPALQGVEFMERYLEEIDGENAFLRAFPHRAVHRLLLSLSREYASAPVNLFEPVCLSAMGLTLCGRSPLTLDLTSGEVERLAQGLENRAMIRPALEKALNRLAEQSELPSRALRYAAQCLPWLEESIRAALSLGKPERAFLLPAAENAAEPELLYGEAMDNRAYEQLLERLLQADSAEQQAALIVENVHSLADLLDLLTDLDAEDETLAALVKRLPESALAGLRAHYADGLLAEREADRQLFRALEMPKGNG